MSKQMCIKNSFCLAVAPILVCHILPSSAFGSEQGMPKQRSIGQAVASLDVKQIVQDCLADSSVPPNKKKHVTSSPFYLCKKNLEFPNDPSKQKWYGGEALYSLLKVGSQLRLIINIDYRYVGKAQNKKEVFARISRAKLCVLQFYKRHGLTLDLNLKEVRRHNLESLSASPVDVDDHGISNNERLWSVLSSEGKPLDEALLCKTLAHEIAHLAGLQDSYAYNIPEADCPDAIIGEDNDIMKTLKKDIGDLHFNEMEIRQIIAPLCEQNARRPSPNSI